MLQIIMPLRVPKMCGVQSSSAMRKAHATDLRARSVVGSPRLVDDGQRGAAVEMACF